MRIKLPFTLAIIFSSPCVLAQTAVTGSLADFGRDTAGGQTAASWGLPQSTGAQSGPGQPAQPSGGQSGPGQQGQTSAGQSGPGQQGQTPGGQSGPGQQGQTSGGQSGPGQQGQTSGGQNGQGSAQGDGPRPSPTPQTDPNKGEPNLPPERDRNTNDDGSGDGEKREPNRPDGDNSDDPSGDGSDRGDKGDPNPPDDPSDDGDPAGDYKPLDDGDPQYDPTSNDGGSQIPSGCAEAGSTCAQCVRAAEENIQFNRNYLHIAWSISHSTLDYANKRIAFGDTVSGIHGAMALSWQLAGKPQIEEAMASLRKTYGKKYKDYIKNIESSLHRMADCEAENYSIRDLYERFGFLYLEFIKARYESPD